MGLVIIHWNQPERCQRSLASFDAQSVPVDTVIIDNGSKAQALDDLRSFLPEIPVQTLGRNTGFGPAANVGLQHWLDENQHEFLVVAPHDALPEPDCIERMVALFEARPEIGLAGADVGDERTTIMDPYMGSMSVPSTVEEGWEPAAYAHGTLLMARRECLLDIGLFDERYFAYGEEVDLGLRATAAGWEVGLVRGARVHNPSVRSGPNAVEYLQNRNTLLLVREHSGPYHAFILFLISALGIVTGTLRDAWRPPLFKPRARLRALFDHLRGRYGPPPPSYFETFDRHGEPVV